MIREEEHVIFDTYWRLDDEGLADYVANSEEWIQNLSEEEQYQAYSEYVYSFIGDEKANLDIELDGTILMYGSVGRWNGTSYGADPCGSNIANIFDAIEDDEFKFYVKDGDVWATSANHDGTSLYLFRLASDDYIEKLEEGEPIGGIDNFIANTTSIAQPVCDVYGW